MIKEIFKKKIPISANRFLNIKDIQGNFLYTTDGKVLAYLKIYPKNCKLMSNDVFDKIKEKYNLEDTNHLVDLLYEAFK